MKSTDKFLFGIVGAGFLLVVVAFTVVLVRPKPAYQPDDTPEGVAYNYIFALQEGNYARAYGYLSSGIDGYPASVEDFTEDLEEYSWNFDFDSTTTLEVESARLTGKRAFVTLRETRFFGGGLFSSSEYTNSFEANLAQEQGAWKIVSSDEYWAWCWDQEDGCR